MVSDIFFMEESEGHFGLFNDQHITIVIVGATSHVAKHYGETRKRPWALMLHDSLFTKCDSIYQLAHLFFLFHISKKANGLLNSITLIYAHFQLTTKV